MKSISLGVIGSSEGDRKKVCSLLGKKGTVSDITFYNNKENEVILTVIESSLFPKKLSSLFQTIALTEFVIFTVSKESFDRFAGECILTLELLGKRKGFIVTDYEVRDQVEKIVSSNEVFSDYQFFYFEELDFLKSKVFELEPNQVDVEGDFVMIGDHFFDVKGIGTVFLGMSRKGCVKKYDKLQVSPLGKELTVRSIQMQGKDVDGSVSPARLGLAVRGVSVGDMQRGFILSNKKFETSDLLKVSFTKTVFYKKDLVFPKKVMVVVDCQYLEATIESVEQEIAKVVFSKKVTFLKGDLIVFCDQDSDVRIIGHGNVL